MIKAVMIDTREPDWVQKLKFGSDAVSVVCLDQGDLMAVCDDSQIILVERKTPDDLLASIRDGRLLDQASDMLLRTRWAYLVITGEFQRGPNGTVITERGQTAWAWNAIQGALLSVQELGVFIIHAAGDADYEACVMRLAKRSRQSEMVLEPAKLPRVLSASEAFVASLPGIGVERTNLLLTACSTPAWALVALTDPKTEIAGIPHSVKVKVRSALGLHDIEQMGVLTDTLGNEVLQTIPLGSQ